MRKLYKQFGLERIPELVEAIDLPACSKISRGFPEYEEIIRDPNKLPGLRLIQ